MATTFGALFRNAAPEPLSDTVVPFYLTKQQLKAVVALAASSTGSSLSAAAYACSVASSGSL